MQDDAFREWLEKSDKRPLSQIRDNIARVRRIEDGLDINIDMEYMNRQCEAVLNRLNILNAEYLKTVNLPTDSAGLSSLKTSVRKYIKFRNSQK